MSAASISAEVEGVGGQPVSAQTIRRTTHQIGLHGSRPRRKTLLKIMHRKARKQFVEDKQTKDMDYKDPCCKDMLQGSVHNSWKLKTSQFLHGQHTHRTCHPMSMFGMLWIGVYDSVFQFLPISSNFAQPLKMSGPTFHRPQSTTRSTLCEGDGKWWSHQILTGVWTPPPIQ